MWIFITVEHLRSRKEIRFDSTTEHSYFEIFLVFKIYFTILTYPRNISIVKHNLIFGYLIDIVKCLNLLK